MPLPLRLLFSETIFPPCLLSPCCASVAFPVSLGCDLPVWFVFGFAGLRWFSRGWFSLCMVVFALSSVLTLLFLKREPTLSAMLVAAVFTASFSFSVCISFFTCLSSFRAVSFCLFKSRASACGQSAYLQSARILSA